MCGIAGIAFQNPERSLPFEKGTALLRSLDHRGPDASGRFEKSGVHLFHTRLKVIDLKSGQQPMIDSETGLVLVYNGEIYNFASLREELKKEGLTFQTRSDTEVLLQGWKRHGENILPRLRGMFAFCVWNPKDQSLTLVRDRLGVKPLYYFQDKDHFAFSSEMGSILDLFPEQRQVDPTALNQYLSFGYNLGESAMVKPIKRLSPGTLATWSRNGQVRQKTWWALEDCWKGTTTKTSLEKTIDEFEHLLQSAVDDRLVSDVPLGLFLSGGLDSSVVAALTKKSRPDLNCFSIAFQEKSFDELPNAKRVADHLDFRLNASYVETTTEKSFAEPIDSLSEPFADTSIIPTYYLSQWTKQFATVALSGDGGDELLAGYITHQADRYQNKFQSLPKIVQNALAKSAKLLPVSSAKVGLSFKIRQFLTRASLPQPLAHASWRMVTTESQRRALLPENLFVNDERILQAFRNSYPSQFGTLNGNIHMDYKTYLLDDILTKVDRASMAHGLEVRSPFLDNRLIEFCANLPEEWKLNGRTGKFLLWKVAERLGLGPSLKAGKRGFSAPVGKWMQLQWRGEMNSLFEWKDGLNSEELKRLYQQNSAIDSFTIFHSAVFQRWAKRWGVTL